MTERLLQNRKESYPLHWRSKGTEAIPNLSNRKYRVKYGHPQANLDVAEATGRKPLCYLHGILPFFSNTLYFLQSADPSKLGYISPDETPPSRIILDPNPCFSSAADGSDTIFVNYILRNLLIIMGEFGDSTLTQRKN